MLLHTVPRLAAWLMRGRISTRRSAEDVIQFYAATFTVLSSYSKLFFGGYSDDKSVLDLDLDSGFKRGKGRALEPSFASDGSKTSKPLWASKLRALEWLDWTSRLSLAIESWNPIHTARLLWFL
jgi:hypothetical protein